MNKVSSVRRSYDGRSSYVIEGNTVRVVRRETDPFYERDLIRKAALENRNHVEKSKAAASRRQQAVSIALPALIVLIVGVVITVVFGFRFLKLKSSVDSHLASVRSMETTLENLRTENDALEQSIDTAVDLAYVYNVAVEKLGMVHAGQGNMISYEKTESEYVRQYERIPEL